MRALAFRNGRPAFRVTSSRRVGDVRYVRQNAPVTVVPAPEGHVATRSPSSPCYLPPSRQPRDAMHQVDLIAGISRVGGYPGIIPESEITSRAKLVTDLVLYSRECRRVPVTWNTKLEIKRCSLSVSHTCVNSIDVVKRNTLLEFY